MNEQSIYHILLAGLFIASPLTLIGLLYVPAPYGRYARPGWGPRISAKFGWIFMEIAALLSFDLVYFMGARAFDTIPLVFLFLWNLHYFDRTFLFPLRLRSTNRNMTWLTMLLGIVFNTINGYVNARYITSFGEPYTSSWLTHPAFIFGFSLFVSGFIINRWADNRLLGLRSHSSGEYKIPHGFLFDYISCPNYLGEVIQWFGWAAMTWSAPGLAFALFTAANLIPRALTHHQWYKRQFPDYPQRKAIVPFIL